MRNADLRTLGLETIKELETEQGILASGREEIFGCIFGRDSLITALKLLKAYEKTRDEYFLTLVEKILINLAKLQGETSNIESGEEPGKIIHEYRQNNHEHLTGLSERPWYLYPDSTMKNYDSVDSTPLFLIAVSKYYSLSRNEDFLEKISTHTDKALNWLRLTMKAHQRGFISYSFHPDRTFGGLYTQSWMDSSDSIFHEDGRETPYPIAPAEAQAYSYLALRLWGLHQEAENLKESFNNYFVKVDGEFAIAFALDGAGKAMLSPRSSMGHVLWAAFNYGESGIPDCILNSENVSKLVERILAPDLFVPEAGIRTLSTKSSRFDPASYHNGSIWPHDTAMIAEGLSNFGYLKEARLVRKALSHSWRHFRTPIELFVFKEEGLSEYLSHSGQRACTKQAWSAASILAEL